jgi:hypothetical protein
MKWWAAAASLNVKSRASLGLIAPFPIKSSGDPASRACDRFRPLSLMNANKGVFGVNLGHMSAGEHALGPVQSKGVRLLRGRTRQNRKGQQSGSNDAGGEEGEGKIFGDRPQSFRCLARNLNVDDAVGVKRRRCGDDDEQCDPLDSAIPR